MYYFLFFFQSTQHFLPKFALFLKIKLKKFLNILIFVTLGTTALSGPPPSLAEQLKQVLAERERRMSGSSDTNNSSSNISQTLAEEIRHAVNEANARGISYYNTSKLWLSF